MADPFSRYMQSSWLNHIYVQSDKNTKILPVISLTICSVWTALFDGAIKFLLFNGHHKYYLFQWVKKREKYLPVTYKESLEREDKYTQQILQNRQDELNKLAMSCPGVGEITASAIVAEVGNAKQFKNGREMSAWLGLVPSQHSTGGRSTLGGITKTGNKYIRGLLDQCANSIYRNAKTHLDKGTDNQLDRFALRLKSKGKPAGKIAMALANKIVRILWAVLSSGNEFKSNINFQDKDRDVLCLE